MRSRAVPPYDRRDESRTKPIIINHYRYRG